MDRHEWHEPYEDPASPLSRRLALVQGHFAAALDRSPDGPISVISMCAGQGRDVIGVLVDHRRGPDVRATLVELDERNVAVAVARASQAGLVGVDVVQADAGTTDAYRTAGPAAVVLACGLFGNITDDDVEKTIAALPSFCTPEATVIWTRHRRPPDLTPSIRRWFAEAGFVEESFDAPPDLFIGVGAHRLVGDPQPRRPGQRLFDFVGYDILDRRGTTSPLPPGGEGDR
jgi:hypothetical protein